MASIHSINTINPKEQEITRVMSRSNFIVMKSKTQQSHSPTPFHFVVTRIAVAQICRSVGFKSAQNSALSTLTDVATRYLQALAASAAYSANSTGRTQTNILDIVFSIEHLHSTKGFSGGSNLNQNFSNSGPLLDIIKFVNYSDEIPFAKPLPRWCFEERDKFGIFGRGVERVKNGRNHIPRWLPAIPVMGGKEGEEKEFGFGGNGVDFGGRLVDGKIGVVEKMGKMVGKLPLKRGKVRFKMGFGVGEVRRGGMGFGVDLKNGVCRGGKRVLVQIWNGDGDEKHKKEGMSYCSNMNCVYWNDRKKWECLGNLMVGRKLSDNC